MYGIKSIVFKQRYRTFKRNTKIKFNPAVNLIVGEQGSGKTSLFELLRDMVVNHQSSVITMEVDPIDVYAFSFEKDSHRHAQYLSDTLSTAFQLEVHFISHGEYVKSVLHQLADIQNALILFDEPDTALSPRSCLNLGRFFNKITSEQNCQVIATTHNPLLFLSQPQVFNLDQLKWVYGSMYLGSHLNTPVDTTWLTAIPTPVKTKKPPQKTSRFFKKHPTRRR